jgi:hypothetical protein
LFKKNEILVLKKPVCIYSSKKLTNIVGSVRTGTVYFCGKLSQIDGTVP